MDWESQVTKDLHQAESKRESLEESARLNDSKLRELQQNQKQAIAEINAKISALQTKRGQLHYQMSYKISELRASAEKCRTALQTVNRTVAL
jgi:uncharacterized coiled-coil protein SlyX